MTRFKEAFRSAYYGEGAVTKGLRDVAATVGAPHHDDLDVGQVREARVAVTFVDLRGFTKLALALDDRQTVRILQSVLIAANVHFAGFGGSVMDFTDGAMAVFERDDDDEAVWDAARAIAYILSDIRTVVNEDLQVAEDHTVRAAAGLEFGDVLWTRLGDERTNQVKPISGVSFLAGKNSQSGQTNAWEALMGPGMSDRIPDDYKARSQAYAFQFDGEQFSYPRWVFDWQQYLTDLARDEGSLRGRFSSLMVPAGGRVVTPAPTAARRLRDEPYA